MAQDYFYGQQSEQFAFYRIPKVLFTDRDYRALSTDARILYGILLDRMNLSAKNGWLDEQERVYIIFPLDEIMDSLGCARQKAIKLLDELDQKCGLIERQRRGMGKPNRIYVKNFLSDPGTSYFKKYENQTSGSMKIKLQEVRKSNCNNTDMNNTDFSNTDPILSAGQEVIIPAEGDPGMNERDGYRSYFSDQLSFDCLLLDHPLDERILNEILELLVDTMCSTKEFIRISGDEKPAAVVKGMFMKLEKSHIEYVLRCLSENTTKVKNIPQYLLTALYNAPLTIGNYYRSLVNHDMAAGFREE